MPDIYLDVDTALAEVPVNKAPLVDDTDFKTREESVAYNQAGLDLVWNFVTSAGAYTQTAVTPTTGGGDYDWTNEGNGMYAIKIPASGGASINNDTEGYGWFSGYATGILPWIGPVIGFRAAGLNDLLCDSAYSTTRGLAGTALPAAAADAAGGLPISDAGGLDLDNRMPSATSIGNMNIVFATDFATNYDTTLDRWQVDVDTWKGDAVAATTQPGFPLVDLSYVNGSDTPVGYLEDFFDGTGWGPILQVAGINTLASQTSFTLTAGSADDNAYNGRTIIIQDQSTAAQKCIGVIDDYAGSTKTVTLRADPGIFTMAAGDTVTILATAIDDVADKVWEETLTDHSGTAGSAAEALDAAGGGVTASEIADAVWDEATSGHVSAGTFGKAAADILADTNELQGDWADGGRLDLILDARASQTTADAIETDTQDIQSKIGTPSDLDGGGATLAGNASDIITYVDTTGQAIVADTQDIQSRIPAALVGGRMDATVDGTGMETGAIDAIWTRALTEAYAADGATFTGAQALYMIYALLAEASASGTTLTIKKLDGSTTAMTFTLNDASTPTSITRSG